MDSSISISSAGSAIFKRRRLIFVLPCFAIFTVLSTLMPPRGNNAGYVDNVVTGGRHLLQSAASNATECIEASIYSFPNDFFTQEQRLMGGVAVHFIILTYMCLLLTVIVDEYFVPSLDIISGRLHLPPDVAGATFMAIGTSSPELFSSVIGAFITEGDIGIGTIVGSAVFNLLCITAVAGLVVWTKDVEIQWYPVTRDSTVYALTIAALTAIISDTKVAWWEALILLVMFGMYIIIMCYNTIIERFCLKQAKKFRDMWFRSAPKKDCVDEKTPLLGDQTYAPEIKPPELKESNLTKDSYSIDIQRTEEAAIAKKIEPEISDDSDDSEDVSPTLCCSTGLIIWRIVMAPAGVLFFLTVPDCRKTKFQNCYIITFISSTLWIGVLSYVCVWMVTIIGFTFYIPDTVSGLTILAAGTSLPEVVSSIIIVRTGLGNMVMANLIGSNVFDILFCLGAPWFIKSLSSKEGYVVLNSSALTYTTTTLLATVIGLFMIFNFASWKLNRTVGFACLVLYAIFLVLACLYELNILGDFNPPTCL